MAAPSSEDRVRQLVRQRVTDLRLSLAEVSQKIGRNHAYLQQFLERGVPRDLPEKIRPALAAILDIEEAALKATGAVDGNGYAPLQNGRMGGAAFHQSPIVPTVSEMISGERALPIYASAQGGPTGMLVTPDPIDWIPRPRPLQNVPKAFGVYIVGDSMEPAYKHGDMVFVHPSLPPLRGDDVLLIKHHADRDMVAMVKTLHGWNDHHWKLKQWHPAREFQASRREWQQVNVICGKYNRR